MKLQKLNDIKQHTLTVLYGGNGTGKTSVINSMPGKVLIIDTDNGLNSVDELEDGSAVAQCECFDDVLEALDYYDGFDSVVIDTMDKVQELAIKDVMETDGKIYGKDLTHLIHYGGATSRLVPLIDSLVEVAREGKNVLVLVHERQLDPEADNSLTHATVDVALMPKVGTQLKAQARIVGYMFKDFKDTFNKGKKTTIEVYRGQFGGNPKLATKVTRSMKIKAPDVLTNVTWDKLQALITGVKPDNKEDKGEE